MTAPRKAPKAPCASARDALLRWSIDVCREYRDRGYLITLRQLYYQGVTRLAFASGQKSYDRLKEVLAEERLRGRFPLWALVDRTRVVRPGASTRNDADPARALLRAAAAARRSPETFLGRDRWFAQPDHVTVAYEKDALAGIFDAVCAEEGVASFSTRGDPSHAALYQWLRVAAAAHGVDNPAGWEDAAGSHHRGLARRSVILYLGDHDPTGIRIPRTAEATLRTFMGISGLSFPLEVRRVGITLEQARGMRLPPFPAKQSAGRDFDVYVEEFGTEEAWELDALPPETLEAIVRAEVRALFDGALHGRLLDGTEARRATMRAGMLRPDWHATATAFDLET